MSHVKAWYRIYTIYNLPQKMNVWMNEISSKTDESWSMKADMVFSEYTVHFKRKKLPKNSSRDFEYVLDTSDTMARWVLNL